MAGLPAETSDGVGPRLMLLTRSAPALVAMLAMAVVGLGISIYLTIVHYQGVGVAFCPSTGLVNCNKVTSSGNSVLFGTGIPITVPGMLWFVVSGGMALVALLAIWRNRLEPSRLRLAHLLWSAIGLIFVLYLVYAEIVLLHSLCEWCTVIHLLTFATFLLALNRWQQRDLPAPTLVAVPVSRSASATANGNGSRARQSEGAGNSARRPASNGHKTGRRSQR